MLKLSRREGESLKLFTSDGQFTIEIEAIQGMQAKVVIHASMKWRSSGLNY